MSSERPSGLSRRELLKVSSALAIGSGFTLASEASRVKSSSSISLNRNSAPSDLQITDMRACTVAANYDYPIIRIDTNQGV